MRHGLFQSISDLVLIAVIGLAVLALSEWAGGWSIGGVPYGPAGHVLVAGCAMAAVLIRRQFPAVALVAAAVLVAVEPLTGGALAAVAHTAGLRWARLRSRVLLLAACAAVLLAITLVNSAGQPAPVLGYEVMVVLVTGIVCGALPGLAGALAGQRERLVRALRERNAFLEHAHRSAEEQARSRERARIAGEMHDLLGHRLSLIALHSGGLAMATEQGDPEVHRSALLVHRTGRQAMDELRGVLGVLRAGEPAREDTSQALTADTGTRADVTVLVAQSRAAGIAVALDWTGEELTGASPSARRAVDRVIREALTNVHKHAAGAYVTVSVRGDARHVRVEVRNGPETAGRSPRLPGTDLGLVGLHERVRLLGGTLSAGPTDHGGYTVVAHIPLGSGPVVAGTSVPAGHEALAAARTRRNRVATAAATALGVLGAVALQFVTLAFVPYPGEDEPPEPGEIVVSAEGIDRPGDPAGPRVRDRVTPQTVRILL
ncbi:sensor histidine kinase [Streptomyces sp. NPDC056883]|uniref:sensor histidine kinase n=1 Tax=Streptomyces sp. NPDC056883 TaxID=3345959 RepID=UPI0036C87E6E